MNKFTVIDNQDDWNRALKKFKYLDCYYAYEYGSSFARIEQGELFAAFYESNEVRIFYPFIKRKVPFFDYGIFYDIVSPYGYGGPIVMGEGQISQFTDLFSSYCSENSIITETIRFHPLYKNHQLYEGIMDVDYIRDTVAIDLLPSLEEIRSKYSVMNKRNLKKAKRKELTCLIADKTAENRKIFMNLYHETMDRNDASSYYYFDDLFFQDQLKETPNSKSFLLFVKKDEEIIAGVIVLIGNEYAHYHLGASKTSYLDVKPNNLLFDFMIEFCKERGGKVLHLGGGRKGRDGLYHFKSSFTTLNNYQYFIGKKVHNELVYKEILGSLREKGRVNEGYFPAYRGLKSEERSVYF